MFANWQGTPRRVVRSLPRTIDDQPQFHYCQIKAACHCHKLQQEITQRWPARALTGLETGNEISLLPQHHLTTLTKVKRESICEIFDVSATPQFCEVQPNKLRPVSRNGTPQTGWSRWLFRHPYFEALGWLRQEPHRQTQRNCLLLFTGTWSSPCFCRPLRNS